MTTFVDPEEKAYPHGGFTRRFRAVLSANPHNPIALPYGEERTGRCSIPDTFFTIPARIHYQGKRIAGYITQLHDSEDGTLSFVPSADPASCSQCEKGKGCKA